MSRLSEAAKERAIARARYDEAKHEMLEAVIAVIEHEGECYARDIADKAEMPTCAVIGAISSAVSRGYLDSHRGKKQVVYVRMHSDGRIDTEDRVIREYNANVYTPSRRHR
jgi:predicted transcriptional regulator